jgi:D-alanyl-D-alanine carboxypeptidase (penicillin-binding protein 5/6)
VLAAVLVATATAAPPPQPEAHAWLVENADTGEVLASSAANEHVAIASITKLMTVLVALDRLKLTDVVTVDPTAAAVGPATATPQSRPWRIP